MDFITIDFEIAFKNLNSACSMGLVFVENNQIVDKKHYYIQPPTLNFNPEMTKIHGITPEMVKDASKFNEIWKEISYLFNENHLFVAHNSQFDMSVLFSCLKEYNIPKPEFRYVDSKSISSKVIRKREVGSSLKDRLDYFGIHNDNPHDALSDATATAELVLTCIRITKRKSLIKFCNTYPSVKIKSFSELKPNNTFGKRKFDKISIKEIAATVDDFDETHSLFGKNVVFTGELQHMDRKSAMQEVVNLGGIIKSSVSRKTDYLFVGQQDKSLVGEDGLSTKEEKAYELIEKGYDIKILKEQDFLNMINFFNKR